jgi:outer membrane protein assembly factor BamB
VALSLYRRRIPWILAAALMIAALFAATASADADQATSSQENAGHTGFASGGSLDAPPLTQAWSVNLGSTLSYPLIGNGLVYVIETDSQHAGPTLDALSTASGAVVWQRPVTSGTVIAYDAGRVFIAESGGLVTAADAATGDTDWVKTFSNESYLSLTAGDGTVYIGSSWDGELAAIDESNGAMDWQTNSDGYVAVDGAFVYTSSADAYNRSNGQQVWEGSSGSSCDSWEQPASDGGHVLESCGTELNAANGSLLDEIAASNSPAVAGETQVFLGGTTLEAVNLRTGVLGWQFSATGLEGSPLIVNDTVYIGSSTGTLYALSLDTGAQVWSGPMGSASELGSTALPGMVSADGLLVVPYGGTLVAYQSSAPRPGLDLQITSGPTGPTSSTSATFDFSSGDAAAQESCRLDGDAWTPCSTSTSYSDLADGPHVFTVKTTDPSDGSTIGLASQAWSIDSEAPTTTFSEQPPSLQHGYTYYYGPNIQFSSSDSQAQFRCTLDGTPETCSGFGSSSYETGELADGSHTFSVTAVSPVGVAGPPATVIWTVDNDDPVVTINSNPPSTTAATAGTFTFSAKDATAVTYQCAIWANYYSYDATYTSCSSPYQTGNLSPGNYTFAVQATDEAGNVGSATYSWTITAPPAPPVPSINSGPPPYTNSTSATFTFGSQTSGTTFQCSLDGATPQTCTSPDTVENLTQSNYTFSVYAVDGSGKVNPTPATYSWTVRTAPPTTTIDGDTFPGPGSVAFYFHADEQAWFMCEIDGDGFIPCSSPVEYSNLTEGSHTFRIYGTDPAGNVEQPVSQQFMITVPASNPQGGQVTPQISSRSVVRALARQAADDVAHTPLHKLRSGMPMLVAAAGAGRTRVTVVSPASRHRASIVLAQAGASFKKTGTRAVTLRLTAAGRRWVSEHPHGRVLVVVTFISGAAKVVVAESRAKL